jgi:hypothetical protein
MAPGTPGVSVGLFSCAHYLETDPLKLNAQHFPLPCSLRELVLQRYADSIGADGSEQAMPLESLLGYLKSTNDYELAPLEAVMAQARANGDPAQPTAEQCATLQWLTEAYKEWEQRFPVDAPLAAKIRPLKPLAAALAITDPSFFTPGAHPIHQLLNTLQISAIGWQSRLGRAGKVTEQQITTAVEAAHAWFSDRDTDLGAICTEFATLTARDRERASRMAQRAVETEQGRIKTIEAKRQAARMINTALEKYQAPAAIGDLLKGPWYASAQLVWLKFGTASEAWEKMAVTTEILLDSLQTPAEDAEGKAENRRQYIFEVVTQLPKDMRRCLLSLQHDSDAVDDAVGLVEFAHLRVLRQQPLELESIAPIQVVADSDEAGTAEHYDALDRISVGQWFRIDAGESDAVKVQLALKMDAEKQLLFTNQAGIKALQLTYRDFADLVTQRKVVLLQAGASFSICLARAVGINSSESLKIVTDAMAQGRSRDIQEYQDTPPVELVQKQEYEIRPAESEQSPEHPQEQPPTPQQESIANPAATENFTEVAGAVTIDLAAQAETLGTSFTQQVENEPAEEEEEIELNFPMGTWLGFHDGATPMMAKLAVHDSQHDNYIFVNREGIKLRELNKGQLIQLMDDGLVDILQTQSSFREKVTRARDLSEE